MVALPLHAHSPYNNWDAFRNKYLQIATNKVDTEGDVLGEQIVLTLRHNVPASRALVTRAPDLDRIASLLYTNQIKVALLSSTDMQQLVSMELYKDLPITILLHNEKYFLIARSDMPEQHVHIICRTLLDDKTFAFKLPLKPKFNVKAHPGTSTL